MSPLVNLRPAGLLLALSLAMVSAADRQDVSSPTTDGVAILAIGHHLAEIRDGQGFMDARIKKLASRVDAIAKTLEQVVTRQAYVEARTTSLVTRLDHVAQTLDQGLLSLNQVLFEQAAVQRRVSNLSRHLNQLTSDLNSGQVVTGLQCPFRWWRAGDSCYIVDRSPSERLSWWDAQRACARLWPGANLASIHASTQPAVDRILLHQGRDQIWIGLKRVGDSWGWSDGSAMDVTDWSGGQPDDKKGGQDCGYWYASSGQWFSSNCTSGREFACQLNLVD